MSIAPPKEAHVTYQLQYRTCGKASCNRYLLLEDVTLQAANENRAMVALTA